MKQFLETICIYDGRHQHIEWHQRRIDATLKKFCPMHPHTWHLQDMINVPAEFQQGTVRCRIIYDAHHIEISYQGYEARAAESLKTVHVPSTLEYRYKYADRTQINDLYAQKGVADDILMIFEGWVTDTSIANIAFLKNDRWYTPAFPLLAGTTWKRLVSERILMPKPINQLEIQTFEAFKLFNALLSFEGSKPLPVSNIR